MPSNPTSIRKDLFRRFRPIGPHGTFAHFGLCHIRVKPVTWCDNFLGLGHGHIPKGRDPKRLPGHGLQDHVAIGKSVIASTHQNRIAIKLPALLAKHIDKADANTRISLDVLDRMGRGNIGNDDAVIPKTGKDFLGTDRRPKQNLAIDIGLHQLCDFFLRYFHKHFETPDFN